MCTEQNPLQKNNNNKKKGISLFRIFICKSLIQHTQSSCWHLTAALAVEAWWGLCLSNSAELIRVLNVNWVKVNYTSRPKKGILRWFVLEVPWWFKMPFAQPWELKIGLWRITIINLVSEEGWCDCSLCPPSTFQSVCTFGWFRPSLAERENCWVSAHFGKISLKEERAKARRLFHWEMMGRGWG